MKGWPSSGAAPDDRLYAMARRRALHIGLGPEEAEDCAEVVWEQWQREGSVSNRVASEAEMQTFVHRRVSNYRRSLQREQAHFVVEAEGGSGREEIADLSPGPEDSVLREEFWQYVCKALAHLTLEQRRYFYRHDLDREPIREIAASVHKTPNAVQKTLARARKRLQSLLELTEAEMREYLIPVLRSGRRQAFFEEDE